MVETMHARLLAKQGPCGLEETQQTLGAVMMRAGVRNFPTVDAEVRG